MKPPFAAIVFDMDGVLADTSACHARAYADLWEQLGVDGPAYAQIAGRPTREVLAPFLAAPAEREQWVAFKQERARAYLRAADIAFADALPCLNALRRTGLTLALATSASQRTAAIVLSRLGLESFFEAVLTAEDAALGKPAPDLYREALRRCRTRPLESLVVEDSSAGLEAALASGACAASLRSGLHCADPRFFGAFADLFALLSALEIEP